MLFYIYSCLPVSDSKNNGLSCVDVNNNSLLGEPSRERLKVLSYCQNCIAPVAIGRKNIGVISKNSQISMEIIGHIYPYNIKRKDLYFVCNE